MITHLQSLIGTMLEAHDRLYIEEADYARTINIPTLGVGTTEFDLSENRGEDLFEAGREATIGFLDESWDFEGYKAYFRQSSERPSRRRRVAEAMRQGSTTT